MTRLRMIFALPFCLLGLALIYLSGLIGGDRMADLILSAMKKNLSD